MPTTTLYSDGDNSQLRDVIFATTPQAIQQTKSIAKDFQGKTEIDTCRNIFNFLKTKIRYKEDGFHQKVKLPSALLRERVGDCKSYSVFTYAILTNLGIPCKYVLTSYNNNPTPSHIYVITDSGIIIDAVWGTFNSEKKPTYKFYKKVDDMRISRIAGVKSPAIGCSSCDTKMGAVQGNSDQWYRDNKNRLKLKLTHKANNYGKKIPYAPIRGLIRKFVENNGGGIATSIWRKAYMPNAKKSTIPAQKLNDLKGSVTASAKAKGVKFPTQSQSSQIDQLSSVKVNINTQGGALKLPTTTATPKAQYTLSQAWDKVMGSGQYALYSREFTKPYDAGLKKLVDAHTIPASTQKDIANWKKFLVKWYEIGGNPYELYESVNEGRQKSPRGKDANYMLMVSATRGLKVKDLGLIIRGFVSAFGGERFSWGSKDTYIFGNKNKGIGATTVATITAYISLATALFGLLSKLWSFGKSLKEESEAKKKMRELESNGWILEQDYLNMPVPRPKVTQVKQISVPKVDAPNLEDVGSVIEEFENLSSSKKSDAYTPQTKEQYEAQAKQGTYSPLVNNTIEEAKTDKGTADYLALATKVNKAIPNSGETIVRYVKFNPNSFEKDKKLQAGFGNAVLPILIGVGVIMALNTSKKQLKNG